MSSWHSYPSSYALGHKALTDLLLDCVTVEEKVDGSQFSFGMIDGHLRMKSKGQEIYVDPEGRASEKMFQKAADSVRERINSLRPEYTYRAEYLAKPKHNTLAYDRVPHGNLIIFDVNTGEEAYLSYFDKMAEAQDIGLEVVPLLFNGWVTSLDIFDEMLNRVSILGGNKIEGVVVKNYTRFGLDKKILIGKFVSEEFKETHGKVWKKDNPVSGDIVQQIIADLRTPARWNKAIQHLAEAGKLTGSSKDIGSLFIEVPKDVEAECAEDIKDTLFEWAWPQISRGITAGMAQWYKEKLLSEQPVAGV